MNTDWTRLVVAHDSTHHVIEGQPAYSARYERVQKYHPPGLAPARDSSGAFHVGVDGVATYRRRYLDTYGFYEGRAAVREGTGWCHILPDGHPLYSERFDWCGNFQEQRCTVRIKGGRYMHILLDGSPACPERYRYAGDFRDGIAVIQHEDGMHTHVDANGGQTHGRRFLDLDVYHKGLAGAQDESGWHHIDQEGRAIYRRRFAAVEPFYNGQARVVGVDGAIIVIDELGKTLFELREAMQGL